MIYTLGETVYDIIFKNGQPVAAKAGGSMLNATVSLGRMQTNVSFISEYSTDNIGTEIDNFLKQNNIITSNVYRYSTGKTSVAIAFLNDKNDAQYSFYKQLPQNRLNITFPPINANDIVLFGSYFAISTEIRHIIYPFLQHAKKQGALLVYDPNFRKAHLHELPEMLPLIEENMQLASIVKGSDEDFEMIYGVCNIDEAYNKTKNFCNTLVYTCNSEGVYIKNPAINKKYDVKTLKPISTIGAGDNFNAGLVYALYKLNIYNNKLNNITETTWQTIINSGINFASDVCMSYDNYVSEGFANEFKL